MIQTFTSIFIITLLYFCYNLIITEKKCWISEIHSSALKKKKATTTIIEKKSVEQKPKL